MLIENLPIEYNVRISVIRDGDVIDRRESHNVLTNTGRAWLARLVGASAYPNGDPTPHTAAKIKFIGLGCGGSLQTQAGFIKQQSATVTVSNLEDPVPFKPDQLGKNFYLKQVIPQATNTTFFPSDFRTKFMVEVAETEISYEGSTTAGSLVSVGTNVPISEAGLYLSTATDGGRVLPANAKSIGEMVCYDVFSPVFITPNVMVRIEWELRF